MNWSASFMVETGNYVYEIILVIVVALLDLFTICTLNNSDYLCITVVMFTRVVVIQLSAHLSI